MSHQNDLLNQIDELLERVSDLETADVALAGSSPGDYWALLGNSTILAGHYIGTTDANDVRMRRNNVPIQTLVAAGVQIHTTLSVEPADASGQLLGAAGNRWDLHTQAVQFGGATTANVVTIPNNLVDGLHISDAGGIEYLKIISTDVQPIVRFNDGGVDVDFFIEAVGHVDAFRVLGNSGLVRLGALGAGYVSSDANGDLSNVAEIPLVDLGSWAQGRLIVGGGADWTVLAAPAAAGYALVSSAASLVWDQTPDWTGLHTFLATVHVKSGATGAVADVSADNLVVEQSGAAPGGISILVDDGKDGNLIFGTPADTTGARVQWTQGVDLFTIGTATSGGDTRLMANTWDEVCRAQGSNLFFGVGTTGPDRKLEVLAATGPQFRITQFDVTHFTDFDVSGAGNLTIAPSGTFIRTDAEFGIGTDPGELLHLLSSISTKPALLIENTNADAQAPTIDFYKNTASPANNDDLGAIDFYGETSTGAKERYAYILAESLDVTNGDTGGGLRFTVAMDAVERNLLDIAGYNGVINQGEVTVNRDGQDVDFVVESVGVADALFVQGSDGQITLGALTAGFVKSSAGGVLSAVTEVPLTDLAAGVRGDIIRRGAADWETHSAKADGAALVGDGVDIGSTLTPTWKGIHTHTDNIVLDDGAGDSPSVSWVGEHNDTIYIFLDDDAVGGNSDLVIRLCAADVDSRLLIQDNSPATVAYVDAAGNADFQGHLAVGGSAGVLAGTVLRVSEEITALVGTYYGVYDRLEIAPTANFATVYYGFAMAAKVETAWTQTAGSITAGNASVNIAGGVAATINVARGLRVNIDAEDGTISAATGVQVNLADVDTGLITTSTGLGIISPAVGTGQIVTQYGIYIGNLVQATNNYAIYSAGGTSFHGSRFQIGGVATTTPDGQLVVHQDAGAGAIPALNMRQDDPGENIWEAYDSTPALVANLTDAGYLDILGHFACGPNAGVSSSIGVYFLDSAVDTTTDHYGIYSYFTKTLGATDHDDGQTGAFISVGMNQNAGEIGNLEGIDVLSWLQDGSVGDAVNTRDMYAVKASANMDAGNVYGDILGGYFEIDQDGGTVGGDAFGLKIYADLDGTVSGTAYLLYLDAATGLNWSIYSPDDIPSYWEGQVGIGGEPTNKSKLYVPDSESLAIPAGTYNIAIYARDRVLSATTNLMAIEGEVTEIATTGGATIRAGAHGTVVNTAGNNWYVAGSIGVQNDVDDFAAGVVGVINSEPTSYTSWAGLFVGQVYVETVGTSAANPVVTLCQKDVDEPFLKLIGTASAADLTRSIVNVGDVSTATVVGYVKIKVQDDGNQVADGDYFAAVYSLS